MGAAFDRFAMFWVELFVEQLAMRRSRHETDAVWRNHAEGKPSISNRPQVRHDCLQIGSNYE